MTKVFVVLTSVVAIVLSCLTVATAARWTNVREDLSSYQQLYQSEFVKRMNSEAVMAASLAMKDDEVQRLSQLMAQSEQQREGLASELATTRNELARQTNEAVAAEAGRKKLEEILDVTASEQRNLQKQNQVLLAQNTDLQTRNQRLASRVLELTGQLTIANDENRNLQEKLYAAEQGLRETQEGGVRRVAAGPAPVGVVPAMPATVGPIAGEVTGIDGNYVSINVGESSGVSSGMPFMVYRGQTYVGDLQVDTVRPGEAGGRLTLVRPGQNVRVGDRVVYGLETSQ